MVTPAVLGVGYDTVNEALMGQLAWTALLIILIAKTVASAACVGVGLPVGMIGPTLVMGAMLGGLLGVIGNAFAPGLASEPSFYVMLGMAAMMAAVLQAPLAALLAVLELTANPAIILPAMLIIVVASLTVTQFAKAAVDLSHNAERAWPAISTRPGIATLDARRGSRADDTQPGAGPKGSERPRPALSTGEFTNVARDRRGRCSSAPYLNANDLDNHLVALGSTLSPAGTPSTQDESAPADDSQRFDPRLDALKSSISWRFPAMRKDAGVIHNRATLLEALAEFRFTGVEALCVLRGETDVEVVGVLTRDDIDRYAQTPHDR